MRPSRGKTAAVRRAGATAVVTLAALGALGTSASLASRKATARESAAMWKVVDRAGECQHPRGRVSTVSSRYGRVTIGDSRCGDGSFILRRPSPTGRWRIRLAGSDIGAPDRCAADRRKVPVAVLRDLGVGAGSCPGNR